MENGSPNRLPDWTEIIDGKTQKPDNGSNHVGRHSKGSHAPTRKQTSQHGFHR